MEFKLHPKITELLCARLCHDMISPVSAINNGVELVTEFSDDLKGEALELIAESARKASSHLQFFRVAYGSARSADGSGIGLGEARRRTLDALGGERITIDWPETVVADEDAIPREGVKLIINLVMLATELLPGAGGVAFRATRDGDAFDVTVTASKEGLSLARDYAAALDLDVDVETLTPRTVQAYYACVLAKSCGEGLQIEQEPGQIQLSARVNALS